MSQVAYSLREIVSIWPLADELLLLYTFEVSCQAIRNLERQKVTSSLTTHIAGGVLHQGLLRYWQVISDLTRCLARACVGIAWVELSPGTSVIKA